MNYWFIIIKIKVNYQDKGHIMNGLERYGCQIIIYTPKNTFYISSPVYCKEGYRFWNVGWLDFKNELFYQTNTLIEVQNGSIFKFVDRLFASFNK